jgi:UDP-N-acetylglucosamine acyltransferase
VGWNAGIHQFCRLGAHSMVGACTKVVQDIPLFMIADGNPAGVRTINKVGLERSGFSAEDVALARTIYKILYREGLNRTQAVERLQAHPQASHPLLAAMLDFIAKSERGLASGGE